MTKVKPESTDINSNKCGVFCARLCVGKFDQSNLRSKSVADSLEKSVIIIDKTSEIRGRWNNRLEFILSCIGFAVGLGNVWRFPIRVYESGGGAFLIPYTILCFGIGIPFLLLELGIGQFSGRGPTKVFKMVPIMFGIGWSMVLVSMSILIYYAAIISWSYFYLFASLTAVLPWSLCTHNFNSERCLGSLANKSMYNSSSTFVSSTSEYWDYYVTGFIKFPSREPYTMNENPGSPQWHLTLCLLFTWAVAGFSIMYGVKISGRVIYFSVLYPYFAIICLIIRGCTLPGASNGIKFYLTPNWKKIYDPTVLRGAVEQLFFSCSIAIGGMITYASYNGFHDNFYRDAIIIILVDFLTSFIAGFAVFSILGYMAQRTGMKIEKVITSGSSLFFITFTEALATLPAPQFWTILLMLMAISLGMDSQFAMLETITTGFIDQYPILQANRVYKAAVVWVIGISLFLCGLLIITPGGEFWFDILDRRISSFGLPLIALSEAVTVGLIYGIKNLKYDYRLMTGFTLNTYWFVMIAYTSPILIFGILLASIIKFESIKVRGVSFPMWAEILAFVFLFIVLLPIFAGMIYTVMKFRKTYFGLENKKIMKKLIEPPVYWGPFYKENWLLESFYRNKLLEHHNDPKFIKYLSQYENINTIVQKAENIKQENP